MRKYSFMIYIFAALLVFANHSCSSQKTIPNSDTNQEMPSEVILEVVTESKYMVYPPGSVINIRLFSSGRAEYDYYPEQTSGEPIKLERREVELDKNELDRVKTLISELGETVLKSEYSPTVPILDASIVTKVIFSKKKETEIVVLKENHSNLILEKKKGIYPQPLLNLLLFVQDFDQKVLVAG